MQNFDKEMKKVWTTLTAIAEDRRQEAKARKTERALAAKERALAAKERIKAAKEREAERALAAKERALAAKERALAAKEREAERAHAAEEREKAAKEREAERALAAEERAKSTAKREADDAAWNDRMDKLASEMGGFSRNYGKALEEEFVAALQEDMRLGDIVLTDVEPLRRGDYEVDIAAQNGSVVAVGEIKSTLGKNDVLRFVRNILPRFAEKFPDIAKNREVLGMVGGNLITKAAALEAEKRGLIILRLKNKKVIAKNVESARPITPAH